MTGKKTTRKQTISATLQQPLKWSGLQARMTFSYVWVTVACILLLEILVVIIAIAIIIVGTYPRNSQLIAAVEQTARHDAGMVSLHTTGAQFDPHAVTLGDSTASLLGNITNDGSINIENISVNDPRILNNQAIAFAVVIDTHKNIEISSYPNHYTLKTPVSRLIPYATSAINSALAGKNGPGMLYTTFNGFHVAGMAAPIWKQDRVIGALYVEAPFDTYIDFSYSSIILRGISILLLISSIIAILLTTPIGGIFGLITTRGVVRRLRNLVTATTLFADGNYDQRVSVTRKDEVGQLEQQFNRMAEQLVESIAQRQALAEQNARLAERSRISRELHDAISQDLFSLSMLSGGLQTALPQDSSLQPQIAMLGTTTTSMIREMRALLLELRPSQLEDLGLAESLKELANSYSIRLGITVSTEITSVQLNAKAQHTLLRISQEALANAVRHANATTITLSLIPFADHITFTIRDNGSGFDPDQGKAQHGLGLRLMQERIQELDGTFTLQSTPGHGTWIHICLPQEHTRDSSSDC